MTQIRIDTERTREVARRLLAESDRLAEIGHELQNATGGLDTWAWDGRSRSRAEPLLNRVRPESARAADRLDELGRKLRHVADTFEQEDDTASRNLAGMPWVDFSLEAVGLPSTGKDTSTDSTEDHISDEDMRSFSKTFERIWQDFTALLDVFKSKLPFLSDAVKEIVGGVMDALDQMNFWKTWHEYNQVDNRWLNNQASYDELLDAKNEFIKSVPGVNTAIGLMDIAAIVVEQAAKLVGVDDLAQLAQDFQDHLEEVDIARGIEDTLHPPPVQ